MISVGSIESQGPTDKVQGEAGPVRRNAIDSLQGDLQHRIYLYSSRFILSWNDKLEYCYQDEICIIISLSTFMHYYFEDEYCY